MYKYPYKKMNDYQFIEETGFKNFKGETVVGEFMELYFDGEVDKSKLDLFVGNHIAVFPVKPEPTTAAQKLIKIREILNAI
jgi:DNA-binding ferritin-like protein (Dps family)